MNILVIDIGTSSMRGILYHENGEKVFTKQIRYQPVHDGEGKVEQDPKDFESALLVILRAFSSRSEMFGGNIDAISITSQRSAIIPADKNGDPLMDAIMWQDIRNRDFCEEVAGNNDRVRYLSGADVNCVFSGGKMGWVARALPEVYKKVCHFLTIPEYLIHRMTGEYTMDWTYGSRSNLMDIRTCTWSDELLSMFGVEKDNLAELKAPGEISGYITASYAEESGVPEGTPVISAGGDQQCAALGQGVYKEGILSIVAGTGAYLVTTSEKVPDILPRGSICNCSAVEGKYVLEANVLTCTSAFDWFLRTFYDWDEPDYREINRQLEDLYAKKSSCLVLPYFQGRSTPDWNASARASFHNVTLGTSREELLKALVEGIFMEIENNIEQFRQFTKVSEASISGGMTRSGILNQMQADVYGMRLVHYEDTEATANGAFMSAIHRMEGISFDEAFDRVRAHSKKTFYEPDEEQYQNYRMLRKELNEIYRKLK